MDWKARYESLKAMREIEWATEEMRRMRDTVAEARAEAAKARRRKREVLAQLKERDAIIDELLVLLGQHLHPAFDERCIALRARVNALRNGETP